MIKFICYPKCTTCQRAKKWFDDNKIEYEFRDIKLNHPTLEELIEWHKKSGLPVRKFFNTSGLLYKSSDLKNKLPKMSEDEMLKLLATDGMLVKRPLVIGGDFVLVDGENVGTVIGRRGETLDAVQNLASLAADNGGKYYRVSVNVGDYREKREQMLTSLAKRIANQVLKTGRGRRLEPMNPYERRIIHTAVQAIDGVVSSSVGKGDARRVVIYPENGEMPKERAYSSDRRFSRPRRNNNSVKADPDREPKRDTDVPLYENRDRRKFCVKAE